MKKNDSVTGFPSPAEDYKQSRLSLDEKLIRHPSATYFVEMKGDAMVNAGISDGDILVVDRSIYPPKNRDVIVAIVDGHYITRRYEMGNGHVWLRSAHVDVPAIRIEKGMRLHVWGVVTVVLHYP